MQMSEFARTLVYNGQGTDHAWGGNYLLAGGSVRGGQMPGSPVVRAPRGLLPLPATRGPVIPQLRRELWLRVRGLHPRLPPSFSATARPNLEIDPTNF